MVPSTFPTSNPQLVRTVLNLKIWRCSPVRCFLKWWYPTTIGFPTKNDHFEVFTLLKMIILRCFGATTKTYGCWVPPFKETRSWPAQNPNSRSWSTERAGESHISHGHGSALSMINQIAPKDDSSGLEVAGYQKATRDLASSIFCTIISYA